MQYLRIVPVLAENFGAVVEVAVRRPQKLTDAGGDFCCIGCIGLQGRMDQGVALYSISHDKTVAQRRQDRHQNNAKDQAAQVYGQWS